MLIFKRLIDIIEVCIDNRKIGIIDRIDGINWFFDPLTALTLKQLKEIVSYMENL